MTNHRNTHNTKKQQGTTVKDHADRERKKGVRTDLFQREMAVHGYARAETQEKQQMPHEG